MTDNPTINQPTASVEALLSKAVLHQQNGDNQRAVDALRQVLEQQPDHYQALMQIAGLAYTADQIDAAGHYAGRALAVEPNSAAALGMLGQCHHRKDRLAQAIECFRRAAVLSPDNDAIHFNLAVLHEQAGDPEAAEAAYTEALDRNNQNHTARNNLIMVQLANSKIELACSVADKHLQQVRGRPWNRRPDGDPEYPDDLPALPRDNDQTTVFKLSHDSQQLDYLLERGLIGDHFSQLSQAYQQVAEEMSDQAGLYETFDRDLPERCRQPHWQLMNRGYNRPIYVPAMDQWNGPLINPDLDVDAIEQRYLDSPSNVAWFDELLAPEALERLRDFCRSATIWYDIRRNYLGAYFTEGFGNRFTVAIAEELRLKFPRIFKEHRLTQAWSYKYGPQVTGIAVHADAAAVNVNFWISPDEANLDAASGGLKVYTDEAPMSWDFDSFNNDREAIERFLAEKESECITVPHRENRALLFNSNLFHKTDRIEFRDDYLSRRINVTMLFGRRESR